MTALIRRALLSSTAGDVASVVYLIALVPLAGSIPLPVFNVLLFGAVVPLLWLIWTFCSWAAHKHASRYARDVEKIHAVRLPERERAR